MTNQEFKEQLGVCLAHLTDSQAAKMVGVGRSTVEAWRAGRYAPHTPLRRPVLHKLASHPYPIEQRVEDLLTLDGMAWWEKHDPNRVDTNWGRTCLTCKQAVPAGGRPRHRQGCLGVQRK